MATACRGAVGVLRFPSPHRRVRIYTAAVASAPPATRQRVPAQQLLVASSIVRLQRAVPLGRLSGTWPRRRSQRSRAAPERLPLSTLIAGLQQLVPWLSLLQVAHVRAPATRTRCTRSLLLLAAHLAVSQLPLPSIQEWDSIAPEVLVRLANQGHGVSEGTCLGSALPWA